MLHNGRDFMAAQNQPSGYGNVVEPCTVVLFGASGDLAKRKVIPAMFDLAIHKALGARYGIIGFSRTAMTDESFRAAIGEAAKTISEVGPIDPDKWSAFAANLHYVAGEYGDATGYQALEKKMKELDSDKNLCGNRLFYLSTPPEVYKDIIKQLGQVGLSKPCGKNSWT